GGLHAKTNRARAPGGAGRGEPGGRLGDGGASACRLACGNHPRGCPVSPPNAPREIMARRTAALLVLALVAGCGAQPARATSAANRACELGTWGSFPRATESVSPGQPRSDERLVHVPTAGLPVHEVSRDGTVNSIVVTPLGTRLAVPTAQLVGCEAEP